MDYQPAKFQCCRLSLASLLAFENLNLFCKTEYRLSPSKFQISLLSGSNFMEVSVRHQKHYHDVIPNH